MKQFEVSYSYDGRGIAIVTAESKEAVEEAFYNGDWVEKEDKSTNYILEEVQ